jgi:serine/threonine protein kinase
MHSQMQHENVVSFIGALTLRALDTPANLLQGQPSRLCIVLEYMEGGSVTWQMEKQGRPFSEASVCRMGLDVARGLAFLHSVGIIHRDVKGANMLMDEHGKVRDTPLFLLTTSRVKYSL